MFKTYLTVVLLLACMLALTFDIQLVRASGTIYIRANGSIDPPTAPIYTADNVTYTFTSDITFDVGGIVIERDNIVVDGAGHSATGLSSPETGTGISLSGRSNVTIKNTKVEYFLTCIGLYSSLNNSISGNSVVHSRAGIYMYSSSGNKISGNDISASIGMWLFSSSHNRIVQNNVTGSTGIRLDESSDNNSVVGNRIIGNLENGIEILSCSGNTLVANNITGSGLYGIYLVGWGDNVIYHNNFDNPSQAYEEINAVDIWDDGYPSGGNYWSDYTGVDEKSGPNQDQPGSDGIGDTSYPIDYQNEDRYPLMNRFLWRDVAVTGVLPVKTVVGQGYSMNTSVTVANQGESTETFNVSTYANTSVIETREVTLTVGNFTTITVTWNTTGFAKGNYTISAIADTVTNELDTEDNTGNFTGIVKVTIPGDVDGDFKVTMGDINALCDGFGSTLGTDGYYWHHPPCIVCPHSPNCDIDSNRRIDMGDINYGLDNFGKHYP